MGIENVLRALHPTKASDSIVVTDVGIVTDGSAVQSWKALLLMSVTDVRITTIVSEVHPRKARCPIDVIPVGITTDASPEYLRNFTEPGTERRRGGGRGTTGGVHSEALRSVRWPVDADMSSRRRICTVEEREDRSTQTTFFQSRSNPGKRLRGERGKGESTALQRAGDMRRVAYANRAFMEESK